jgi:hypothetical protein
MVEESNLKPDILFHYTTIESFKKIIESHKIHATRYDQMNDTSEIEIGLKLLLDTVKKYPVEPLLRDYKDFLTSGIEDYKEGTLEVYVLSLSEAADSLEQWRAYAPRGGVAIGFDYKKVQKGFLLDIARKIGGKKVKNLIKPTPVNRLMKCLYTDSNGDLDLMTIVAERFFKSNSYPALFAKQQELAQMILHSSLSVEIYRTICSIKHGAYASEKEWRCVNYKPNPHDYPVNLSESNQLYIEMEFAPKEFIKEVWISPNGNNKSCESAVAYFRQKDDLCFTIKNSKIPFRG